MTDERTICATCGTVLPLYAPQGLCPKCLLHAGFEPVHQDVGLHFDCPHCHNPIELIDGAGTLAEVECPSCGSSVNVLGGETAMDYAKAPVSLGRFELVQRVGVGAFGAVWKAYDPQLDRMVAVKIPRKDQLLPAEMELFLREARSAAQLKHPKIVGIHEVGREGETVFLVGDFIDGVTLSDWLSGKRPSARVAAEMCVQIAEALHHAHQSGVVHRDLKPSNIMLTPDDSLHVMDFGLAKRDAGEVTMTIDGKILGTPAYMSPEQAKGEAHTADGRSDIYSVGAIMFELLTGQRPFQGSEQMLIHQVIHDDPPPPRKLDRLVPRDLETICLKCLRKSAQERYQTADELHCDLVAYLQHRPISARRLGWPARAVRAIRRRPAVTGLAFLCTVLVCLVAAVRLSAVVEQRQLRAETTGEVRKSEFLRLDRLQLLAKTQDYGMAIQDAEQVMEAPHPSHDRTYALACVYALAAASATDDHSLARQLREKEAASYRKASLKMLSELAETGYFKSVKALGYLINDHDLDPVRGEAEFINILERLQQPEVDE